MIRGFDEGVLRNETPVREYLERIGQDYEDYLNASPEEQGRIEAQALAAGIILGIESLGSKGLGRLAPDAPNTRPPGVDGINTPETSPNTPSNGSTNAPDTDSEAGLGDGARSRFEPDTNRTDITASRQKHILEGQVQLNADGTFRATGAHYPNSTNIRINRNTVEVDPGGSGVFRAEVDIRGPDGNFYPKNNNTNFTGSTFFPETWSAQRVLDEISNAAKQVGPGQSDVVQSPSGIRINIVKSSDGAIITAHPAWPQ